MVDISQYPGCEVAVIEHSKNAHTGKELMTFQLRYWRGIHSSVMSHRIFSRNVSSSRAVPVSRLINEVRNNIAGPTHWGLNQKGMQADQEIADVDKAKALWKEAAESAATVAEKMMELGLHKQVANRILEPFTSISAVITSTEWDNWYELRDHGDAQPEIRDLARAMKRAASLSCPREVSESRGGDARAWHLPYVTAKERQEIPVPELLARSASRCARVSSLTHDQQAPDGERDRALYQRLAGSRPLHASPLEHQAVVSTSDVPSRNFYGGWIQHRVLLEESGSIENLKALLSANKPPAEQTVDTAATSAVSVPPSSSL